MIELSQYLSRCIGAEGNGQSALSTLAVTISRASTLRRTAENTHQVHD